MASLKGVRINSIEDQQEYNIPQFQTVELPEEDRIFSRPYRQYSTPLLSHRYGKCDIPRRLGLNILLRPEPNMIQNCRDDEDHAHDLIDSAYYLFYSVRHKSTGEGLELKPRDEYQAKAMGSVLAVSWLSLKLQSTLIV